MTADTPPAIEIPVCMQQAAARYQIPLRGMVSLWLTEGGMPGMKNRNKNGTYDFGAFQINTVWANRLYRDFGITEYQLTHDFCTSAYSAAYIVKFNIIRAGGDFWEGIGRYHSATPHLKNGYIQRVYQKSLGF